MNPFLADLSPRDVADRWARLGLCAAAVLATLPLFNGYQRRTFDSWVHMFFADHYRRSWFDLWEPRWYGGFEVVSYPPLAHQLLALLSWPLGLQPAYVVMTAVAMLLLAHTSRAALEPFVGEAAAVAVFLLAVWPTAHRFAYVYGQLPMLVATPVALGALAALSEYLEKGERRPLGRFALLAGATAGAHHVTVLFLVGGAFAASARAVLDAGAWRVAVVRRVGIAALAAGLVLAAVVGPFFVVAAAAPQAEIPHVSRDPLWERPVDLAWLEHVAQVGLAISLLALFAWRRRVSVLVLSGYAALLTLLALGTTTPLPRLLFGAQWRWLTYDKFHFWASVVLPALLVAGMPERYRVRVLALAALVLLPATAIEIGHKQSDALQPEYIEDISPLLAVLGAPGAERYRHLTLGFGDQFCRLSIEGRSPNVDGDYHTARTDTALRQSGVATLDATKYYPRGPELLRHTLSAADTLSLRWVFVYDEWYYPFLFEAGFELREVWSNGVSLFEKAVPPLLEQRPPPRGFVAWSWGVLPLACLLGGLALARWRHRAPKRDADPRAATTPRPPAPA